MYYSNKCYFPMLLQSAVCLFYIQIYTRRRKNFDGKFYEYIMNLKCKTDDDTIWRTFSFCSKWRTFFETSFLQQNSNIYDANDDEI